jgi:hypothetical protein
MTAARTSRRCSASTWGYRSRNALTSRVDPSISLNKKVTTPPGNPRPAPAEPAQEPRSVIGTGPPRTVLPLSLNP